MTVLVMGATGNVGAATLDALRQRGEPRSGPSAAPSAAGPRASRGSLATPATPKGSRGAGENVSGEFLMSGYAAEAALLEELAGAHVVLLYIQLGAGAGTVRQRHGRLPP